MVSWLTVTVELPLTDISSVKVVVEVIVQVVDPSEAVNSDVMFTSVLELSDG